jgi:hypothetical protein
LGSQIVTYKGRVYYIVISTSVKQTQIFKGISCNMIYVTVVIEPEVAEGCYWASICTRTIQTILYCTK